jgi:hypothetical protein
VGELEELELGIGDSVETHQHDVRGILPVRLHRSGQGLVHVVGVHAERAGIGNGPVELLTAL